MKLLKEFRYCGWG